MASTAPAHNYLHHYPMTGRAWQMFMPLYRATDAAITTLLGEQRRYRLTHERLRHMDDNNLPEPPEPFRVQTKAPEPRRDVARGIQRPGRLTQRGASSDTRGDAPCSRPPSASAKLKPAAAS